MDLSQSSLIIIICITSTVIFHHSSALNSAYIISHHHHELYFPPCYLSSPIYIPYLFDASICMYVYMYVCVYVYMQIYLSVCMYVYMYDCMYFYARQVSMYICMLMYMYRSYINTSYYFCICMIKFQLVEFTLSTYHYYPPHISLLPLPTFSSISLCTISYSTVKRLSIQHVRRDMRVPYWYCYKMGQTLTFKIR